MQTTKLPYMEKPKKISKPLCLLLGMFFALPLYATTVYKSLDKAHTPVFSDHATPNSQAIELAPLQTYTPPAVSSTPAAVIPQTTVAYQLEILTPKNEETITMDIFSIPVTLSLSPQLQKGDKVQLILNGKPYGHAEHQLQFTLNNLYRGAYKLKAHLLSAEGDIKAESNSITFFQKRAMVH